jgi:hypothetical protein
MSAGTHPQSNARTERRNASSLLLVDSSSWTSCRLAVATSSGPWCCAKAATQPSGVPSRHLGVDRHQHYASVDPLKGSPRARCRAKPLITHHEPSPDHMIHLDDDGPAGLDRLGHERVQICAVLAEQLIERSLGITCGQERRRGISTVGVSSPTKESEGLRDVLTYSVTVHRLVCEQRNSGGRQGGRGDGQRLAPP